MNPKRCRRTPIRIGTFLAIISVFVISSCASSPPIGKTGISTKVTIQAGDTVTSIESMLAPITPETKNELVQNSDAVIIGKVVEILPSKQGTDVSGHEVIYTDVLVDVDRYLLGAGSSQIAIRVLGGRVNGTAMIVEDEPIFYLDEEFVGFLFNQVPYFKEKPTPSQGINLSDYYAVVRSSLGKWPLENGKSIDYSNKHLSISSIEKLIAENKAH